MQPGIVCRNQTNYLAYLAAVGVISVGVGLLRLSEACPDWGWPTWQPILSNLGGLLIASVGMSFLWELRVKRMFVEEIFEVSGIAHELQAAKLMGVTTEFSTGIDWKKLIDSSTELDLLVASAQTWRNSFRIELGNLARRNQAKINVILPDPSNAQVMSELSRRFGTSKADVISLIRSAENFFKDLADSASMPSGAMTIWYTKEAPLYTFYRFGSTYVYAGYRYNGKGHVPTLVSHKGGCIADFIDEQFASLTDESRKLARRVFPVSDPAFETGVIQSDTLNLHDSHFIPGNAQAALVDQPQAHSQPESIESS